ncbi:hypothetical protein [Gemmatimonas sp. UBA7669]|uniref:hypothetical protein n=1 Tax=Gemmatimonas sp. UBA7669 TaxID=1946568 RepID=UPI0025C73792|nr:hypothetical protein [Gemmatimonas sp. UBA7669]
MTHTRHPATATSRGAEFPRTTWARLLLVAGSAMALFVASRASAQASPVSVEAGKRRTDAIAKVLQGDSSYQKLSTAARSALTMRLRGYASGAAVLVDTNPLLRFLDGGQALSPATKEYLANRLPTPSIPTREQAAVLARVARAAAASQASLWVGTRSPQIDQSTPVVRREQLRSATAGIDSAATAFSIAINSANI